MARQQKLKIELPFAIDDDEVKENIAQDVIDYIIKRAQRESRGFNPDTGREFTFPGYTEEYRKKKGTSKVDLTLDDEMLGSIQVLKTHKKSIVIGFPAGSAVNAKAEGNQIGSYGRSPDPNKARPFLGLPKNVLQSIVETYIDDED